MSLTLVKWALVIYTSGFIVGWLLWDWTDTKRHGR